MRSIFPGSSLLLTLCLAFLPSQGDAQDYDSLIQESLTQRNAGQFADAEITLRQALELPADKTEVRYLLAMTIAFQQRFTEANSVIDLALAEKPDDVSLLLGKARIQSFQGLYSESETLIAQALEQDNTNIEAINLSARISMYQQMPSVALDRFNQVLARDSTDLEALIGRYDALYALGQREAADETLLQAERLAPAHIDVQTRRDRSLLPAISRNQLLIGVSQSRFSTPGLSRWRDQFVEYRRQQSLDSEWYVQLSQNQRFDDRDNSLSAGLIGNRQGSVPWHIWAGFSPDKNFSASSHLGASMTIRLNQGSDRLGPTLLTPSLRIADYTTGTVRRLAFDFEHYLRGTNIWFSPGLGWVQDENSDRTFTWSLATHWQASERFRTGAGFADGAETENKITTQTRSRFIYVRWQFTDELNATVSLSSDQRRNSYTRDTISLTIGTRF